MAKPKTDTPAGKSGQSWDCRKMRFPEVLCASGNLLDRYPVLAALPAADKVPDALLRYVLLRCGKGSPFYGIGEVGERKRHILLALDAQPDEVLRVTADKDGRVMQMCVAYLRLFEHSADLALLLALEEKNQQDLIRIAQPVDTSGSEGKDGLKDDAILRAYETRTKLSSLMRQQAKDIQDLRAQIFAGDEEVMSAATTEDAGASFSERFAKRPEFKGTAE